MEKLNPSQRIKEIHAAMKILDKKDGDIETYASLAIIQFLDELVQRLRSGNPV